MSDITLEEQEQILMVAEGLLKEPESWVQGSWKCDLMQVGEKGVLEQATDSNGQQLYKYCIHGAVNQAAFEVLGEERAIAAGAGRMSSPGDIDLSTCAAEDHRNVVDRIGLDDVARELYDMEAMEYNDAGCDEDDEYDDFRGTHEGVLEILRTGLARIRTQLKGQD